MKKFVLFWVIGSVVGLYTTFVIQSLWNWFAAPAFHVPEISFWGTYGLVLLIGALRETQGQDFAADQKWKAIGLALDACIPDSKKEEVNKQMDDMTQFGIWMDAGLHVVGQLSGNTFTLVLGFAIHTVLA